MFTFFKKQNSGPEEKIRAHLYVSGRVQGVCYRETCRKKAEKLGVSGWIKNIKDGRVEGLFEGDKSKVEKIVNWARKGSIWASIDSLDVIWEDYKQEFSDFRVRYDIL
ncbi:MAG: acylphosphatase [Candidatus Nealsonbacteria bacterium]